MIDYIEFENFRNLDGKRYLIKKSLTAIVGANSSGKTNILDGIRYAFSAISGDYFKVEKTDFKDSDDSLQIIIKVALENEAIPSLGFVDSDGSKKYGFALRITKTQSGRYKREITLLTGEQVDWDILTEDKMVPSVYSIPLARIDSIHSSNTDISVADFIKSENDYRKIKETSKQQIKDQMSEKIEQFKRLCEAFNHSLDVDISDPIISNEKLYLVEGNCEHGVKIGSGYKSIANIFLHTFNDKHTILLIDEIENHIHPSLLRTFMRELRKIPDITIIATTHSPVVVNECFIEEIIDVSSRRIDELDKDTTKKLNIFLHPGRGEIIFADNVILVEGYTEELLLKHYIQKTNDDINWTVVNVACVMFKPYIDLANLLGKRIIVISDNDKANKGVESQRFLNLRKYCKEKSVKIIEMDNTLESDLVINKFINENDNLLKKLDGCNYYVAKNNHKKTQIIQNLISNEVDLSEWHVIKELHNEFRDN